MSITTAEEAKNAISGWLKENSQEVKVIDDNTSNFHFETNYPLGSMKKQRILQPKNYPGLCVLLNGVAIADEHKEKLKKMPEEERDKFYGEIKKDLVFLENSYEMDTDEHGVVQQIQFSYEFYFDALTKTQLYKGLLLNHRTLLYIVIKFNEKFGIPTMPTNDKKPSTLQ
jgi:hypothetical protein